MSDLGPQHDIDALERQALYWRGLLDPAGHGPIEARMNAEAVERRLRRALARLEATPDSDADPHSPLEPAPVEHPDQRPQAHRRLHAVPPVISHN